MAAGEHGRVRVGRSFAPLRDVAALPGWLQLAVVVGVAGGLALIAHFAGVSGQWAPLVIGCGLGLMTALVTSATAGEEPPDYELPSAPRDVDVIVEVGEDLDRRALARQ
jgi:hypothetical protein